MKITYILSFFFLSLLSYTFDFIFLPFPESDLVRVEKGEFIFGNKYPDYELDETPQSKVFTCEFYIYKYEISNYIYCQFLNDFKKNLTVKNGNIYWKNTKILLCQTQQGDKDSNIILKDNTFIPLKPNYPVCEVSWYGAIAFCNWLNIKNNLKPIYDFKSGKLTLCKNSFRLPLEIEWEKAASWNKNTKLFYPLKGNIDNQANFGKKYNGLTPVGFFNTTSPYGCFDMAGNVYEWCIDTYYKDFNRIIYENKIKNSPYWYDPNNCYAVTKGGCWRSSKQELRSTNKADYGKKTCCDFIGFRIVYVP